MSVLRFATLFGVVGLALFNEQGKGATLGTNSSVNLFNGSLSTSSLLLTKTDHSCSTNIDLCEDFDGNECGCGMLNCDYDIGNGNICTPHQLVCGHKDFWPGECRRKNTFYSIGGRICKNSLESGDCDVDWKSVAHYAINLNGPEYTDSNQIRYLAHNSTRLNPHSFVYKNASDYGTSVCKKKGRGDVVDVESLEDATKNDIQYLLHSYIEGYHQGHVEAKSPHNTNCLTFSVPIKGDGVFQLNIKSAEMEHYNCRSRRFDIKLNGVTIFPQIDLFRLAGKNCVSLNLLMNFVIRDGQQEIIMSGFTPMKIIGERATHLQFCMSKCQNDVLHTNFIASAFSFIRLKGKGYGPFCQ